MKKLALLTFALLAPALARAGFSTDNLAATNSFTAPYGSTTPASQCTSNADRGKIFVDTAAPSGQQIYECEGTAGWKLQGGTGGGSGSGTITGVTAGYGLTGGGTSGGVTLNLVTNSTSYIQNSNTQVAGSTASVAFLYVGSSASVSGPLSANSETINGSGPSGTSADVNWVGAYGTGNNALKIYNTSAYFNGNKASLIWSGPTSGGNPTEVVWNRIKAGPSLLDFGASPNSLSNFPTMRIDQTVTDPVFYFGNLPGDGQAGRNVSFCFGGFAPYVLGNPCFEYDQPNNNFKFYQQIHAAAGTIQADQGVRTSTLAISGLPGAGPLYADASGNVSTTTASGGVSGSTGTIGITIDGGSSAIVAGSTRSVTIPYACTFSSWTFTGGDSAGSISIHVSSSSIADYRAGRRTTISGSNPMFITANVYNNGTMAGWSQTTFQAGDIISFVNDSASTLNWLMGIVWVIKS